MSLLTEATRIEQGSAKMAWFGPQGSGKTMTATQVGIGLAHTFHKDAPVAFFDTEKGSDFAKPIFDAEGIKMLRVKSRAFSDLLDAAREAEQAGCCALIVDSMSHVWAELMESFCRKRKISRIQFFADLLKAAAAGNLSSELQRKLAGWIDFIRQEADRTRCSTKVVV